MKITDLIAALFIEKGYEVKQTHENGKINGWELNDNFYLWVINQAVVLVYRQDKAEDCKTVSYKGNPCSTVLYHPKSIDIIESWLDNLEKLTISNTNGKPGTGFGSFGEARRK